MLNILDEISSCDGSDIRISLRSNLTKTKMLSLELASCLSTCKDQLKNVRNKKELFSLLLLPCMIADREQRILITGALCLLLAIIGLTAAPKLISVAKAGLYSTPF